MPDAALAPEAVPTFFATLPLYGALHRAGKTVYLASLSSTPFESTARVLDPG